MQPSNAANDQVIQTTPTTTKRKEASKAQSPTNAAQVLDSVVPTQTGLGLVD